MFHVQITRSEYDEHKAFIKYLSTKGKMYMNAMFSTGTCIYFIHQHPDIALCNEKVFRHALAFTKNL